MTRFVVRASTWWRAGQAVALGVTGLLIVGLYVRPDLALTVIWNAVIPVVPVSLLVSPALWRGLCPLATLNMISNGYLDRRIPTRRVSTIAATLGIVLLALLIPARRFLLNTDGAALGTLLLVVAGAAAMLGAVYDAKSGFCNALCPVLPVERLYGQHPLVTIGNPRCTVCNSCTGTGCLDLAPTKSIAQTLGPARRSHRWLTTPFGVFACAFPGFVIAYYLTDDVIVASAGVVYLRAAIWSAASYVTLSTTVRVLDVGAHLVVPLLAGAAAALYYWFVAAVLTSTYGWSHATTIAIRATAFVLVGVWLWRALPHPRESTKTADR